MSAARHFLPAGSLSGGQLKQDIKDDITTARGAQLDMQAAGQSGIADRMGVMVDEALDELNDANNGTWQPRHV
ncbi:hypothetical protein [Streptomyces sasae]|uniref:hypothetical protein n=1 Tax=Streptomyces sasae TaxID=1266772 RepID=UPI00292F109A|nr:hypothetical protein [Streptomyces sasae]